MNKTIHYCLYSTSDQNTLPEAKKIIGNISLCVCHGSSLVGWSGSCTNEPSSVSRWREFGLVGPVGVTVQ